MLADPAFPNSVQKTTLGQEKAQMGPYMPTGRYLTTSAFEAVIPCP